MRQHTTRPVTLIAPLVIAIMVAGSAVATDLVGSTYLGGSGKDGQHETAVAVDAAGNIFVASRTNSSDFPAQPGCYAVTPPGGDDVFIAKFNSDLSVLLAATYLGGTGDDGYFTGVSMAIDASGHVFVTGKTNSTDFPHDFGAYSGGWDIFLARLDNDLQTLEASRLIGGASGEYYALLALDNSDQPVLVFTTANSGLTTSPGAVQATRPSHGGGPYPGSLYLAKYTADLSSQLGATYLGGSNNDYCEAIEIDGQDNIYLAGWTASGDYPTTTGAFSETHSGGIYDSFASVVSGDFSNLVASTFLGGSQWDFVYAAALDGAGHIYLAGHTASSDHPMGASGYDHTYNGRVSPPDPGVGDDLFLVKMTTDLQQLLVGTYIGSSGWENGTGLTVAPNGRVFVSGNTRSTGFAIPAGAYDPSPNGSDDIFVLQYHPDLTYPMAGTFLGGSARDLPSGLLIDADGNVLISASTSSSNYPTEDFSYRPYFNGQGTAWDAEDVGGDVAVTLIPAEYFVDSDGDGTVDASDNCPSLANGNQLDSDSDGIGNACDDCTDLDADGYGHPYFVDNSCDVDNCPELYNPMQFDTDADGIGMLCDNCPTVYNPEQLDSDGDNIGDACETCCRLRVGDANNNGDDEPTIGDVSTIVDALFINQNWSVIPCLAEADINQSGGPDPVQDDITIGDVSSLIDYLFISPESAVLADCL